MQYDEDNRTTQIQYDNGTETTIIHNIYDITGRRIAKIQDGVETRYILDLSGRYEKVIAEADDANQIQTFFVYGMGQLNYSIKP